VATAGIPQVFSDSGTLSTRGAIVEQHRLVHAFGRLLPDEAIKKSALLPGVNGITTVIGRNGK
jgi:hypothetical protein